MTNVYNQKIALKVIVGKSMIDEEVFIKIKGWIIMWQHGEYP